MAFIRTKLNVTEQDIMINLDHVENVFAGHQGAVFVMLPAEGNQRIFETDQPFEDVEAKLIPKLIGMR